MTTWTWPADFPADCPPVSAVPADGSYYRIVKTDPPQHEDFVSLFHLNRRRANAIIRRGAGTQCETMGLSVFAEANDAVEWARRLPQIGSYIARLTLSPCSGKMLSTPREGNSHHTWWYIEGFNPLAASEIVIVI